MATCASGPAEAKTATRSTSQYASLKAEPFTLTSDKTGVKVLKSSEAERNCVAHRKSRVFLQSLHLSIPDAPGKTHNAPVSEEESEDRRKIVGLMGDRGSLSPLDEAASAAHCDSKVLPAALPQSVMSKMMFMSWKCFLKCPQDSTRCGSRRFWGNGSEHDSPQRSEFGFAGWLGFLRRTVCRAERPVAIPGAITRGEGEATHDCSITYKAFASASALWPP